MAKKPAPRGPAPKNAAVMQKAAMLLQRGDLGGAVNTLQAWLHLHPDDGDAWAFASVCMRQAGQWEQALQLAERAVEVAPHAAQPLAVLGETYAMADRLDDAIGAFRASIAAQRDPAAVAALARALCLSERDLDEAEQLLNEALARRPNDLSALFTQSVLASKTDRIVLAQTASERFLRSGQAAPATTSNVLTSLGWSLAKQGKVEEALDAYGRAVQLEATNDRAYGAMLFLSCFSDKRTPEQVFELHAQRGLFYATTQRPFAFPKRPAENARLRVGYVSPDLRSHAVMTFLEPILRHHDRSRFEVFCYSTSDKTDAVTERVRGLADTFRDVARLSDDELGRVVNDDRIDLLFDLAVNSAGNRQAFFARRAAPVQLSYLGYATTTGLSTMDYRVTDAIVDPPGTTEKLHTEKLLRLPEVLWCFQPSAESPEVDEAPRAADAPIRFGHFSWLAKITDRMLDAWCEILRAVPNSTLTLKTEALDEPKVREEWLRRVGKRRIDPSRVALRGASAYEDYLRELSELDVALDTTPYCGGTTACNALWMGCPVVTLAGRAPWSRVTASILHSVGLERLVADSFEQYVEKAVALAQAREERAELRRTLRDKMRGSALADAPRFVRAYESALLGTLSKRR